MHVTHTVSRWVLALAAACSLSAISSTASASPALSAGTGASLSAKAPAPSAVTIATVDIDISNIFSFDPYGDALNTRITTALPANARVTGIGWNTTQLADSPSWLSEMAMSFESSTVFYVQLRPGVGDDFSGTESYTSGGIVDLVGLGLDFDLEADGLLGMEFFETFDDFANDWDGRYLAGSTITVRYEFESGAPAPEPMSLALAGVALLGLVATRRARRRH